MSYFRHFVPGRRRAGGLPIGPHLALAGQSDSTFDGTIITCVHHQWGFDRGSGNCVTHLVRNTLHPYELRVEDDEILVDVGPAKPARAPA